MNWITRVLGRRGGPGRTIAVLLVLLVGCAATLSAASSESPVRGGTLVVGVTGKMSSLDPVKGNAFLWEGNVVLAIYDRLLRLDKDGSYVPELATSWKFSSDQLKLTFKLRKGVVFHDGTPFDAEAARFEPGAPDGQQGRHPGLLVVHRHDRRGRAGQPDGPDHHEAAQRRDPHAPDRQGGLHGLSHGAEEVRRRVHASPDRHRTLQVRRGGPGRPCHAGAERRLLAEGRRPQAPALPRRAGRADHPGTIPCDGAAADRGNIHR